MSEASGKNFEAILKPTSSRIELKSNNSLGSLKRSMRSPTMKSSRDSVKDNDVKMKKGNGACNENEPTIDHDEHESVGSTDNEIETMSILLKGYKKIYPLVAFIEKYIIKECSDEDDGLNSDPVKINYDSDSFSDSNSKDKSKLPIQSSKLNDKKIEIIIKRRQRKFIKMQLNEAVKEEGVNAENLLGFINQKKINAYLNISNIMRLK